MHRSCGTATISSGTAPRAPRPGDKRESQEFGQIRKTPLLHFGYRSCTPEQHSDKNVKPGLEPAVQCPVLILTQR